AEGFPSTRAGAVTVVAGRDTAGPVIEMMDGNVVSGTVADSAGRPVSGAKVYAIHDDPAGGSAPDRTEGLLSELSEVAVSDDPGPLSLGRWVVVREGRAAAAAGRLESGEWAAGEALYERLRTAPGAAEVVVREEEVPEVTLRLPRLTKVHGHVRLDGRLLE